MAAYIVAHVNIEDWDAYREYMRHTPRVIHKFGGRFIARGGKTVTLEGPEETLRVVLIEFPSIDHAKSFYNSAEYAQTKTLRDGAGAAKFVAIDGYSIEQWQESVRESETLVRPSPESAT
jgi:uncharacterized protein (DUF1330 family)